MDESLLPPAEKPGRPFPWRTSLALFVPAAALAAGTGLQRWLEGPQPQGDAVLHWLYWSGGSGLAIGIVVGMLRRARLAWIAWGYLSPFAAAALVWLATEAARPVREYLADRREADCRAEGRKLCTLREFEQACARRDRSLLGEPAQQVNEIRRWYYRGPFRPEQIPFRGAVLCSISASARPTTMAVADP
ncbi:MAG TPA: hypothetical protein VLW85_17605 [Myxococcales bacterium]|nr:hypothetical protein [Myxococcales bacterium]